MACIRLFLILFQIFIVQSQGPNPLVRVGSGILKGTWQDSTNGRNYASFMGIPYARPPVGKYRFREPQPVKPWAGVWDATRSLSDCLQYDPFAKIITGSEDCLFINVHTPNPDAGASMPVVVFIHGGAFMFGGGGHYSAVHLMDRDMVFVTFNYRLGPLGFLSTGDEVIPGNAGLKDQAFALRWVRENIMMFGGNPDSITLTGCSAGGASVHYHYLSPLSKGTFHRGIAFSGSAFSSWTHAVKPAQKAKALAAIAGCPTTTSREMAECLKFRPGEVIVNAQIEMFDWKLHWFTPFTPTVEAAGTRDPFLSQYPYIASQAGAMHPLPLITSVTSEEGLYPAASYQSDPSILLELESRWEHLASNIFEYNDTLPLNLRAAVAQKIKNKYLDGKPVGQDTFAGLVQALGDRIFAVDVGKLAQIHAQRSGKPTYLYRYSHRAQYSLSNIMAINEIDYGSEDCLFINVHTPNPDAGASMPVVVFIHGGAFMFGGGGHYSAVHLMDRDMVFVTFNYRLGPLGFLSTGDEVIPGNAGLKDQAFALRWVRENIMMFGGNPDSITLTGCSAGGASVHYHYLSPLSKGTFHRGIAFSGSAFSSWTHAVKPAQKAKALAAIAGCPTTTSREMAECLKFRPGEVIVNAQIEMFDWKLHWFTPFTPTVEAAGTRDPFLSQYPYIASQAGAMHPLPLITSVTSEEGLYPAASYQSDPSILLELESRWEHLASNIFEYNDTLPLNLRAAVAQKIKNKYLDGKPVGQDTFAGLVQALGDRIFAVDVGKLAQIHAQRSGKPTYLYRYSHRAQYSLSNIMAINEIDYGSEDCLFINVHTPNPDAGASMPVVVFIHGGAFMFGGGGHYSAVHLMDRDMVFVTFNYRLGPLGFLSTGDEVIPGNAGLKDQAFALRWVRENIMMFGGNPDSITLTGCSAGGASVHYHYLSPLSKGTFHRGIAFSGSAFSSWTHAVKPAQKAKALAAIAGCPTTTSREMAECLKFRPGEVIVNAQIEMFDWKLHWFTPFTPTVEAAGTRDPFLSQYPYIASQAGAMHPLPLITSVTSEEGLYPAASYQSDPSILLELESRWEHLASNIFEYNDTLPLNLRAAVAQKIKNKYLDGKPVGQDTFAGLVQALGDRIFAVDVGKLAQIHAQRSGKPTYLYRYSHRAQYSLSNIMAINEIDYGVSHADDTMLFIKFLPSDSTRPEDNQMRKLLIDMVYNFANTGVPRIQNGPEWLPVKPGQAELDYLEIAGPKNMEMKTSADFGNRAFWDSLGFIENENYRVQIKDEL